MIKWLQSIDFSHPISLSLSLSCALTLAMFGTLVVSVFVGGSFIAAVLSGVVLAGTLCLSSKWLIRKE